MRKLPAAVKKNRIYNIIHLTSVAFLFSAFVVTTGMLITTMGKLVTADKTKYIEDQRIIEEARIAKLQMEEEQARLKAKVTEKVKPNPQPS